MTLLHEQISEYAEWRDLAWDEKALPGAQARAQYIADLLTLSGYRGLSNKYRIISRIDRPDWLSWMGAKHSPWNPEQGLQWAIGLGVRSAADHFIACYSQDKIDGIPDTIYRMIKRAPPLLDYCEIVTSVPRRRGMML